MLKAIITMRFPLWCARRAAIRRSVSPPARALLAISIICISAPLFRSSGQIGVVGPFKLGAKSSAYYSGLDDKSVGLAVASFVMLGKGAEENVYQAPYMFQDRNATAPAKQFCSEVNLPRNDFPYHARIGAELGASFGPAQRLRLMALGQLKELPREALANRAAFSGHLHYRNDFAERFQFDFQTDLDIQNGATAQIFAIEDLANKEDLTALKSRGILSIETVRIPWIGRGVSQVALMGRLYDYGAPNKDALVICGKDTTRLVDTLTYEFSPNDTLEADYSQIRGRVRHTQGLFRGYSVRFTFDGMYRQYRLQWAKRAVKDARTGMGDIPDSVNANPDADYPRRSQYEVRVYGGLRYDPPHVNNARINLGLQHLRVTDPFEGFYGYRQNSLYGSMMYTPNPKRFVELVFAVKNRTYDKLSANYQYWWGDTASSFFTNIDKDHGEDVEGRDVSWWDTKLKKKIVEMSLRGQLPLWRFIGIWGNYSLDLEMTNRPDGEYLSRSYFSQAFAGGLTLFFDLIGPGEQYIFRR